jgi:hypothetical protein
MEQIHDTFEQAELLWDNGELISVNPENRNSLYRYNGNLYVIWYTQQNIVKEIIEIDDTKAHQLFSEFAA